MKLRNVGVAGGLITGGLIMGIGLVFVSQGDMKSGGNGLMIILGWLVFIPGAIIALFTFFSWLFAYFYRSLGPKRQKIFWVVVCTLFIVSVSIAKVNSYLQSRPEAVAKRALEEKIAAEAEAAQATLAREAADQRFKTIKSLIPGKWKDRVKMHVFETEGRTYTCNFNGTDMQLGTWSLEQNTIPPFEVYLRMENRGITIWERLVLTVDAKLFTFATCLHRGQDLEDCHNSSYLRFDVDEPEL